MNHNNYLYHYGIPGMKWGVRKDEQKKYSSKRSFWEGPKKPNENVKIDGQASQPKPQFEIEKRTTISEDAAKAALYNKQPLASLTNQELRDLSLRIELEEKYRKQHPSNAKKVGNVSMKTIATTAAVSASIAAIVSNADKIYQVWKKNNP